MSDDSIKAEIEDSYEGETEFSADFDYAGQMTAGSCSHLTWKKI